MSDSCQFNELFFKYPDLTPLKLENKILNSNEATNSVMTSYPRRIAVILGTSDETISPSSMKHIDMAISYSEELSITNESGLTVSPAFQKLLEAVRNKPINIATSVNINMIPSITPWIFEYGIYSVDIFISLSDNSGTTKNPFDDIRELIIKRYFSPVKPHIIATLQFSLLSSIPNLIMQAAETGIDEIRLCDCADKPLTKLILSSFFNSAYECGVSLTAESEDGLVYDKELYEEAGTVSSMLIFHHDGNIKNPMNNKTIQPIPSADTDFKSSLWNSRLLQEIRSK